MLRSLERIFFAELKRNSVPPPLFSYQNQTRDTLDNDKQYLDYSRNWVHQNLNF